MVEAAVEVAARLVQRVGLEVAAPGGGITQGVLREQLEQLTQEEAAVELRRRAVARGLAVQVL